MVKPLRPGLKPVGLLYSQVMAWRNHLYDTAWFKSVKVSCPVISVGNLTVGGTGKTPVVMSLVEHLRARGRRPCVLSRGYKGRYQGVQEVQLTRTRAADWYGDEPVLIKSRFPATPVVVGQDRVEAAQLAIHQFSPDVLIADDAFQHRRLGRVLDLVVVDATQSPEILKPLPWGLAREPTSGLARAHFFVLTKVNLAPEVQVELWQNLLLEANFAAPILKVAYRFDELTDCRGQNLLRAQVRGGVLAAAIGQPEAFSTLVEKEMGWPVRQKIFFPDHHYFSLQDLNEIQSSLEKEEWVLVTEKDAVKVRHLDHPILKRLAVVRIRTEWLTPVEGLDHALAAHAL